MEITIKTFIIDSTFIFKNTHEAFFKTSLLIKGDQDNTFLFGFFRDLLRIRLSLGIKKGVLLISKEIYQITSNDNISKVIALLTQIQIPFIHEIEKGILEVTSSLLSLANYLITNENKLFQFCTDSLTIIVPKESQKYEYLSPKIMKHKLNIRPDDIPTFLILTDELKSSITKQQAIRLIELYGTIPNIIQNLSKINSQKIQKKLDMNNDLYIKKYNELKTKTIQPCSSYHQMCNFDINYENSKLILDSYGFYSLTRLLKLLPNVCFNIEIEPRTKDSFHAIVNSTQLNQLKNLILKSDICSIDTESTDKDPLAATLLGVSFSIKKDEAYFVPLIETDLKDITPSQAIAILKTILESKIKFIGHNLKYDYLLLRKNGIKINSIHFDTMLAAYDCFGDWDFFNLSYLSKRLLGIKIKSYKEIVSNEKTFLDLPFKEMVQHGCQDAETVFRLYPILKNELEIKQITEEYYNNTLPIMKILFEMEYNGININSKKLSYFRNYLLNKILLIKQDIFKKIGKEFDLDSSAEISVILKEDCNLNELIKGREITLSLLEQLAINNIIPKLILKYKRLRKKINAVDSISKAVSDNKIRPNFNQIHCPFGQLTSYNPNIFLNEFSKDEISLLKSCFDKKLATFFVNLNTSLEILGNLSKDLKFKNGISKKFDNLSIKNLCFIKDLKIDEILIYIIIGYADYKLSKLFLIDQLTVSTIRHEFEVQYSKLFHWLDKFRTQTLSQGFACVDNKRKYFNGLKSSNIEIRKKATGFAIRWTIKY